LLIENAVMGIMHAVLMYSLNTQKFPGHNYYAIHYLGSENFFGYACFLHPSISYELFTHIGAKEPPLSKPFKCCISSSKEMILVAVYLKTSRVRMNVT
jgi:hypothetical protein